MSSRNDIFVLDCKIRRWSCCLVKWCWYKVQRHMIPFVLSSYKFNLERSIEGPFFNNYSKSCEEKKVTTSCVTIQICSLSFRSDYFHQDIHITDIFSSFNLIFKVGELFKEILHVEYIQFEIDNGSCIKKRIYLHL